MKNHRLGRWIFILGGYMNLLIVGAGGHGQCCYEIAERMNKFHKISFLDDDTRKNKVIGKVD